MFSVRAPKSLGSLHARLPWVLVPAALVAPLVGGFAHGAGDRGALGNHHAVATDSPLATEAAMAVLARGGDAVDAAVAAATTLGVVAPAGSGLGGGGFALVWRAKEKQVTTYDFRETAPRGFDASAFEARAVTTEARKAETRGMLVGVPGEVAGLTALHAKFGKLALADDVAFASRTAREGFPVGRYLAEVLKGDGLKIASHPTIGPLFFEAGALRPRTALVKRESLARTLTRIGDEGAKGFYEGPIAARMVELARAFGSQLTLADLASRTANERPALQRTFGKRAVYTMGSPSAGGLMLLEALTVHGADATSALAAQGAGSSAYLHAIAETMRAALADRLAALGDVAVDPQASARIDALLDHARLEQRRSVRDPRRAHAATDYVVRERGTSHLIVVDDAGNIVSLTTTVNGPFGARLETEDGILLNDELDDFTTRAEARLFLGDAPSPNAPRALARPVSSMMPTLVVDDGVPHLVLGGSGGRRIATACTQVALRALLFGDDAAEAVSAPRVHVGAGVELLLEKDVAADVENALRARGNDVKRDTMKAAVQAMSFSHDGAATTIHAAADPRKYGLARAE